MHVNKHIKGLFLLFFGSFFEWKNSELFGKPKIKTAIASYIEQW